MNIDFNTSFQCNIPKVFTKEFDGCGFPNTTLAESQTIWWVDTFTINDAPEIVDKGIDFIIPAIQPFWDITQIKWTDIFENTRFLEHISEISLIFDYFYHFFLGFKNPFN